MQNYIKKALAIIGSSILSISAISLGYKSILNAAEQTNRNEQFAPEEYNVPVTSLTGYAKIYENKNFEYYFSSTKDILRIKNKKTGFIWSSGAGTLTKAEAETMCNGITQDSQEYFACSIDAQSNNDSKTTNESVPINQMLAFYYYSPTTTAPQGERSLESSKYYTSKFMQHNKDKNEFIYIFNYTASNKYHYDINMRLTFTEEGFDVNIYDDEVYAYYENENGEIEDYTESIVSILPFPFLGQSGGKAVNCTIGEDGNCTYGSETVNNPNTNLSGYIFVPDGSGALIRFDDVRYFTENKETVFFDMYGDPYRANYDAKEFQEINNEYQSTKGKKELDYVPTKQITMPVWGVNYGNLQDAFVAYVTSGDEYFGLLYNGRTTKNEYASISPRFERNRMYNYFFGSKISSMTLTEDECYHYDIGLSYSFLSNDGNDDGYPASYVGMALKYRDYLINNKKVTITANEEVSTKIDFLISDVKKGIFDYEEVVVSTTNQIEKMLSYFNEQGIENINSTLYGWQNGGISKCHPWSVDYNTLAGGYSGFKSLAELASSYNYLINLYTQYALINEAQTKTFNTYCVKALSRDYGRYILNDTDKPITWWEYVNPNIASKWLNDQAKEVTSLGDNVGITTGGINTILVPDYGKTISYADASEIYTNSTALASKNVRLSGDTPNSYLWNSYSDFSNISVFNSQLQCETDSVPFMEIVFSGIKNLYAEYSNFSFYDRASQLKMIDYHLNPSYIISYEENEDIMYTNARDWFSTSFDAYKEIITEIDSFVNPWLKVINNKTIVNREVYESNDTDLGVYINTYANYENGKSNNPTTLIINYLNEDVIVNYKGYTYTVKAQDVICANNGQSLNASEALGLLG